MALGRIFAGLIGRRVGPIRWMLGCCWTSVVLFLLACFAPWPAVALAASVAVGLTGSCLWPTTLGVASRPFSSRRRHDVGLLAAFGNLGGILMPWLVGVTSDWSSLRLGLATSTAYPLLMAFYFCGCNASRLPISAKVTLSRRPPEEIRKTYR